MENTESAAPTQEAQPINVETENKEVSTEEKKEEIKQANLKKFKLTVDGHEFEEEIDLNNEEQIKKELQLARAAKKRMAEASETKRRAMSIIKDYENNPEDLFRKLGPKGHEIAEKILLEKIQSEMMTPEQREVMEMKKKLQAYEENERKSKEEKENEIKASYEAKIAQDFQAKIIKAIDAAKLPKSPDVVKRTAQLLKKNLDLGLELTVEDLAQEVKEEFKGGISSLIKDSEVDQLIELLGPEVMKKIRKYDLEKLKEKGLKQFSKSSNSITQSSKQDPSGLTYATDLDSWLKSKT